MLGYHTRSSRVLARGDGVQDTTNAIIERTKLFSKQVETLRFSCDCYIYNPLEYAWPMHEAYLRAYVKKPVKTLLVGMNPGPFGMAQTGVPFGEINAVRHFLRLSEEIGKPPAEHPARPILGLQTTRSEVSGKRLWSLMQAHYQSAEAFSEEMAIFNYCPLVFMQRTKTAKNLTPDKLAKGERLALQTICDAYLGDIISLLDPSFLIGVGVYAFQMLEKVNDGNASRRVASILHPSPGNPQANKGWDEKASAVFKDLGIWLDT